MRASGGGWRPSGRRTCCPAPGARTGRRPRGTPTCTRTAAGACESGAPGPWCPAGPARWCRCSRLVGAHAPGRSRARPGRSSGFPPAPGRRGARGPQPRGPCRPWVLPPPQPRGPVRGGGWGAGGGGHRQWKVRRGTRPKSGQEGGS